MRPPRARRALQEQDTESMGESAFVITSPALATTVWIVHCATLGTRFRFAVWIVWLPPVTEMVDRHGLFPGTDLKAPNQYYVIGIHWLTVLESRRPLPFDDARRDCVTFFAPGSEDPVHDAQRLT